MLLEGRIDASRRQTSAWTACGGGIVLSVTRTATSPGELSRPRSMDGAAAGIPPPGINPTIDESTESRIYGLPEAATQLNQKQFVNPSIRKFVNCMIQSRSKSRSGRVTGSRFASRKASSKRLASASSRPFSASTDCLNIASRRSSWAFRMLAAWSSSGLSARSGSRCDTTRRRFVSTTSVDWQQGQITSTSLFSFAMELF